MSNAKQQAKERPILFSGPMVCAILEGRKTQTRRVMKGTEIDVCPYGQPGELLWVRETWNNTLNENLSPCGFAYKASTETYLCLENHDGEASPLRWRPSIHMPRVACRILLEVTSVRVERLQDISEGDAIAEGVSKWQDGNYKSYTKHPGKFTHAKDSFRTLWESINGPESWNVNPWVWVVEFKKIEP